jgi:hypothetical protein
MDSAATKNNPQTPAASRRWFYAAVLYFVLGVALGIFMGVSGDHLMFGVHAHMNLLGWVSLALIGLIYQRLPRVGANRLATLQFWLHMLGLPVMLFGIAATMGGYAEVKPLLGAGATAVALSVLLFAFNVLFARDWDWA